MISYRNKKKVSASDGRGQNSMGNMRVKYSELSLQEPHYLFGLWEKPFAFQNYD